MHFFYLDETGDTGTDLGNVEQPIFVLGGVTVRDKGWRITTDAVQNVISNFFNGAVPEDFELHAPRISTSISFSFSNRWPSKIYTS
jgi:hypothetical protein